MSDPSRRSRTLFGWGSWPETRRITQILSKETLGGALLLAGALIGMVWANTPWSAAYDDAHPNGTGEPTARPV